MNSFSIGATTLGLPITAFEFKNGEPRVLILGGVHGDEPEGVYCANFLLREFFKSFSLKLNLVLIPALNVEGVLAKTRQNSRGVDLNRNLPTKDWTSEVLNPRYNPGPSASSEPESLHTVKFLDSFRPQFIVSLHSWKPMLNTNGDCGEFVKILNQETGYPIEPTIGYPTPGCLGTYSGIERNIPTLTYEIERGLSFQEIDRVHVPAILKALKTLEKK